MYKELGMKALELEMTDRVCRMEYSVFGHSRLLEKVTGISVEEQKNGRGQEALQKFCAAWDICMHWNILIGQSYLAPYITSMGHAVYAEDGSDYSDNVHELFTNEEDVYAFDPYEKLPYRTEEEITRAFNENYKHHCAYAGDAVAMTGIYITCMSGLIDMLGWDRLLTCAGVDPKAFGAFTDGIPCGSNGISGPLPDRMRLWSWCTTISYGQKVPSSVRNGITPTFSRPTDAVSGICMKRARKSCSPPMAIIPSSLTISRTAALTDLCWNP